MRFFRKYVDFKFFLRYILQCEDKMLIEFKTGNFRSFKDIVTFSMVASADKEHIETNTIKISDKLRLLKSAVLYGANASGKSNLIKAMAFMRDFVIESSKESQANDPIKVDKFRLSTVSDKEPATFEAIFLIDKTRYRYGFQVDQEKIYNEWLYYVPSIREAVLFIRENDKFKVGNDYKEGKNLESKTRGNALFLSVVAQFNGEISKKILKWFNDFGIISGIDDSRYFGFTLSSMDDRVFLEFSNRFLKVADIGIKEIKKEEKHMGVDEFMKGLPKQFAKKLLSKSKEIISIEVKTTHQKYDDKYNPISDENFSFPDHESEGTQALFGLSAPIFDTIKNNHILIIDELTSKLHPLLTRFIINVFHKYRLSKNCEEQSKAQLIFASHDTSILTNQLFRRDQVWFTQKNEYGETQLYSLDDYRIRKDASFSKDYMMGKFGSIPSIGNIASLFPLE